MGAYEYQSTVSFQLDLKVFLEGTFNGTAMNTELNNLSMIPLTQPYNAAPWNYAGTESVSAIPNNQVVDWVLIEGRDAPDAASATEATAFAQQAAFLLNNGKIVDLDGFSPLSTNYSLNNNLFVVIWHRNHLPILSQFPLIKSGGVFSYDFTSPAGQAYGIDAQKDLGGNIYGMFAGDADANGIINEDDKNSSWMNETGLSGYLQNDLNLDGQENNVDKNDVWLINNGESSQVPN